MDLTRLATLAAAPTTSMFTGGQPYDLIALADLKLELNVSTTTDDAYMAKLITRASRAAHTYCNRTFVPATWVERVWPAADAYPWQLPPGLTRLQLPHGPLTTVASPAGTAPPVAPTLAAVAAAGVPAAVNTVRLTYVTAQGETAASPEVSFNCAANFGVTVPAPGPDPLNLATGYNVYAGTSSFGETLQNGSPISVNAAWTQAAALTTTGAKPPNYVSVVENANLIARPLAEGVDFLVDAHEGALTRLYNLSAQPKPWALPVQVVYSAGYSTIPDDLQEAVILLAKMRYFARTRDPMLRSQNIEGVLDAQYWLGTGIGGQGDLPVDVTEKLDRYRTPVVA